MCPQRVIPTGDAPEVILENVEGDLSISGWGRNEIAISAHPDRIEDAAIENGVRMTLRADASIQIPLNSKLFLRRVDGDLAISSVAGTVALQDVSGDASVRDVGSLTIDNAGEDLSVRHVHGDCTLGRVRGDATVSHIAGNLVIERVEEDLSIFDVRGSVRASGGEDVSLRLKLLPGCTYDIRADDDLSCRIPDQSSARVNLAARDTLRVQRLDTPAITGNTATFQLGNGDAVLNLVAGDDLELTGIPGEDFVDFSFDFGPEFGARFAEFTQQVAGVIEDQVGTVARALDDKINSMGGSEEVASRIQDRILTAARRIEEKINEAIRAAETRAEEERARAEKQRGPERGRRRGPGGPGGRGPWGGGWGGGWGGPDWNAPQSSASTSPGTKPQRPGQPVTSEAERLAVLRMVSEGSISVEQAERLLAALNGKGGDD